jgi:hypothetical protein
MSLTKTRVIAMARIVTVSSELVPILFTFPTSKEKLV